MTETKQEENRSIINKKVTRLHKVRTGSSFSLTGLAAYE